VVKRNIYINNKYQFLLTTSEIEFETVKIYTDKSKAYNKILFVRILNVK